jgi:hypothetical protein
MEKNPLIINFKKPFVFEGKEHASVDLTKLEDWSTDDLIRVGKTYAKISGNEINPMGAILPESDLEYDIFVASEASGLPLEFFKKLPANESGKLRTAIISFFLG